MAKFHSSKALLTTAGGGMHPPHPLWIRPCTAGICFQCSSVVLKLVGGINPSSKGVGRWGLKLPYFLAPLQPPLLKVYNYGTPHSTSTMAYGMASLVICFFSLLLPSNQRTNFCNFVTKVNEIAKTVGFPGIFVHKALRALL